MTENEERIFEVKAEKMLAGQRELPNSRDFRCFKERYRADNTDDFRKQYDQIFPNAPGADL
jgi:t-SNARE complex subunit (syntaxin)